MFQIDPILQIKGFDIIYIKNIQPGQLPKPQLKNKVVAIILRKQDLVFHIFVLHSREVDIQYSFCISKEKRF